MRWLLAAPLLLLAQPALAFDASDALPCLDYQPADVGLGAEAEISVVLDQHGTPTAITVGRYQPDTEDGRRLAMAAAQAVQACSPYAGGAPGRVIYLGPETARNWEEAAQPVITLPDNADGTDNSLGDELQRIINGK